MHNLPFSPNLGGQLTIEIITQHDQLAILSSRNVLADWFGLNDNIRVVLRAEFGTRPAAKGFGYYAG